MDLKSDKVIDAAVIQLPDGNWRMWYKDERKPMALSYADSPDLLAQVQERRAQIAADDGVDPSAVPPDALTASGSGLDPDISVDYALIQVNRVAAARGLSTEQVGDLVRSHIAGRALGFIGEEKVNVLDLNLALNQLAPAGGATG